MDSPHHDKEAFEDWLKVVKEDKNAYFLGMGDYFDGVSASERKKISSSSLHESTYENLENYYTDLCDKFYDKIKFMKGRLIGLLEGNHFYDFSSGITSTQYLCHKLGCTYLGCNGFVRLSFKKSTNKSHSVDIFAHHGVGGGTKGSSIASVEKMALVANADVYMMGDNHQIGVVPGSKLELTRGNGSISLREKTYLLVRTGGFLKAYKRNKAGYIVDRAKQSLPSGAVRLKMTPFENREGFRLIKMNGGTIL